MRLKGRPAIVTGSSRGIGAEIAQTFAREGAQVVVNCIEDVDHAETVVESIKADGGNAKLFIADVRVPADVDKMIRFVVAEYGKLDILVNNAGITRDSLVQNMSAEDWGSVIDTNMTGAYNCSKAASGPMIDQGYGRIINISSVVAEAGNIGQVNYIASKAGVIGLTRGLALELARHGILVNAIAPGFCSTRMVDTLPEKVKAKILGRIPLRRFAFPSEIASVALFLASEECSYMTGQVVSVNGGLHL